MADRSTRGRDGRSAGPDTSTHLQRGRRLALVGILAVGAVLAGVVALGLDRSEPTGTGHDATAVADAAAGGAATPAPDAAVESEGAFPIVVYRGADTLGAEELDFSQLLGTGTPVVLNFWAGQCPPCRAEMPDFQAVYDRYADEFLLVGVDIGPFIGLGTRESAIELLEELDISYPTAYALDARAVQDNDVLGMPTTIFYDGDGEVVARHTGLLTEQAFEGRVREAIDATS
ncbi:MAG TPA: TlpA disulfide reductase family protein [Anaerolineae bacterium]|nr:TlpA disulfide reductase family protein [Anaerolineae bacterium]